MPRTLSLHVPDDTSPQTHDVRLVCAGDCPAQPVQWLWPEKIPLGKVTLLVGDPGTGKSLLALDIAARLSRGTAWPDELKAEGGRGKEEGNQSTTSNQPPVRHSSFEIRHSTSPPPSTLPLPPSSTILLSATDDIADTIRPRLDAAGADPNRIFIVPTVADLRDDFAQLRAAVDAAPDCRLIVIDPINAYVGASDSHFQTVVQKVLAPLAELAAEKRIAILAIAHLRKSEGAAIHRAAGSVGFVAAARSVWTICQDPKTPGRQLLVPLKNNLTSAACGLAYTIQPGPSGTSPRIAWEPMAIHETVDTITAAKKRGPEAIEVEEASRWLRTELAGEPCSASDLRDKGEQFGFQQRTLRRALHAIGGNTEFRGIIEGWWWSLSKAEGGSGKAESKQPTANNDPPATIPLPYREGPGEGSLATDSLNTRDPHSQRPSAIDTPASTPPSTLVPPPSPLPLPPSEKPVPLTTTCPLSGNSNSAPTSNKPPAPPRARTSIEYMGRLPHRRIVEGLVEWNRINRARTSSQPKSKGKRKQPRLPPSNPALDRIIHNISKRLALPHPKRNQPNQIPPRHPSR